MKLKFLLLIIALVATICTAQNKAASAALSSGTAATDNQKSNSANSNSAQQQTISGCLNQSGTAYTLIDSQTGTVYKLIGDTSHLSRHVGHELQITGQAANPVKENATGAPSGNSGKPYVFRVSGAKHIADQCGPSGATANGPSL